ncbi:MAG: hypothetical protein A3H97_01695 [Acidobacteria bacterium RIFCSPLOWO2_02_FULL_65_29]|nr:MAG: hypothetical protein A3H97_01695 [Acidobacteria bacterium RIFCSPLOWO2_02_FULL_65_29]
MTAQPDPRARLDRYLSDSGLASRGPKIVPLTSDASDRRYYRILLSNGESIVLAVHAGPIEFTALPFANVRALFAEVPLPVPDILGHSDREGIVALEDLGDVTLQAHVGAATPVEHAALYREAVALIELLQRRGRELADDRYLPYRIAFDVEKLTWELDFFMRHFVEGYRGIALSPAEREALGCEWRDIVDELAAEPRVLCHRDYHSRNLMLHGGQLHIIDFQDARMGPDTYDLVSLLRDSYVDLTDREIDELIAYFLALAARGERPASHRDGRGAPAARRDDRESAEFRRRFDLMALQRNLKALGTFGYQTTTRANAVYIQYMPRTLRYAKTHLGKYRRFARLRELLAAHVEELR